MHILKIKAIFFDMDGVITHTMPYHFYAWKKVFKDAGLGISELEVFLREGQPGRRTIHEIFRERGIPFTKEDADDILKKKEALFKRIVRQRFIPGARGFLSFLHKKGVALALVTGTSQHEAHRILPAVIVDLFDAVITSDDVRHGKPHPEPYLLALKKLRVNPSEAIVIENAPFGIKSAKAAGLRCIALETSLPRKYLKQADFVFSSFKAIKEKLSFAMPEGRR
jgi:beta-phosphoglucomutase